MKTYKECCAEVAQKHKLGNSLVIGHKPALFEEAAIMFAGQVEITLPEAPIHYNHEEAGAWSSGYDRGYGDGYRVGLLKRWVKETGVAGLCPKYTTGA